MERLLIIANQTLCEQHLLDEIHRLRAEGPVRLHLLVPASHPPGAWTDGSVRAAARRRLDESLETLAIAGIVADGEVSDANPVAAVADVLRQRHFDRLVISTLPSGRSVWLAQGTIRRLARFGLPVTHVVAERSDAMA